MSNRFEKAEETNSLILNMVKDLLDNELSENEMFLGGSRRFAYHNRPSMDTDLFVLVNSTNSSIQSNSEELYHFIDNYGLYLKTSNYYRVGDCSCKIRMLNSSFDITFFLYYDEYRTSFEEHNDVENLLSSNPLLLDTMRELDTPGRTKFKALARVVKQQKVNDYEEQT